MAFPTNPTNGQKANVNGVTYVYSTTLSAWTVSSMFNEGMTANVISANTVTATGNVSAEHFTASGIITTVGNVSGGNIITVGNVSGGNISTAGSLSVTGLTNLGANVSVTGVILPAATNTHDLGTSTARWRNIYTNDLQLSNGIGDYTIVEGEEDLFLYNNKTGKTFKFALIEVDPSVVPPKAKTG